MSNAELFKKVFGIYAEEFWAYPEEKMLDWLTSNVPDTNVGDLISRQAAIEAIKDYIVDPDKSISEYEDNVFNYNAGLKSAVQAVVDLPSVQPEQSNTSEFWQKRANYYRDMCMDLISEMGKGVKIKSVKINENGIEFIKDAERRE